MHIKLGALIPLLFFYHASAMAVIVNPGDSIILEFESLSYTGSTENADLVGSTLYFGSPVYPVGDSPEPDDYLNIGEAFHTSYYEDTLSDVPFLSHTIEKKDEPDYSNYGEAIVWLNPDDQKWKDFQGIFVFEMIYGHVDINSIELRANLYGEGYSDRFAITENNLVPASVPIPPGIILLGSALIGLFGFSRNKPT